MKSMINDDKDDQENRLNSQKFPEIPWETCDVHVSQKLYQRCDW